MTDVENKASRVITLTKRISDELDAIDGNLKDLEKAKRESVEKIEIKKVELKKMGTMQDICDEHYATLQEIEKASKLIEDRKTSITTLDSTITHLDLQIAKIQAEHDRAVADLEKKRRRLNDYLKYYEDLNDKLEKLIEMLGDEERKHCIELNKLKAERARTLTRTDISEETLNKELDELDNKIVVLNKEHGKLIDSISQKLSDITVDISEVEALLSEEKKAPRAGPKAKPKAKPGVEPEPEAEAESEPEAEPKAKPRAESKAKPKAEPKAKPGAEPEAEPESEPEAEPESEPGAEPKAGPKAKPKAKPKQKIPKEPRDAGDAIAETEAEEEEIVEEEVVGPDGTKIIQKIIRTSDVAGAPKTKKVPKEDAEIEGAPKTPGYDDEYPEIPEKPVSKAKIPKKKVIKARGKDEIPGEPELEEYAEEEEFEGSEEQAKTKKKRAQKTDDLPEEEEKRSDESTEYDEKVSSAEKKPYKGKQYSLELEPGAVSQRIGIKKPRPSQKRDGEEADTGEEDNLIFIKEVRPYDDDDDFDTDSSDSYTRKKQKKKGRAKTPERKRSKKKKRSRRGRGRGDEESVDDEDLVFEELQDWSPPRMSTELRLDLLRQGFQITPSNRIITPDDRILSFAQAKRMGLFRMEDYEMEEEEEFEYEGDDEHRVKKKKKSTDKDMKYYESPRSSASSLGKESSESHICGRDIEYLKVVFGKSLTIALAEITAVQPTDPIHYLAHWMLKYRYNQEIDQVTRIQIQELMIEQERLAAEKWHRELQEEARLAVLEALFRAENIIIQQDFQTELQLHEYEGEFDEVRSNPAQN